MHRRIVIYVLMILSVFALPTAIQAQEGELPDTVMIMQPGLHPEGVEWDAEGERFIVGSLTQGGLFAVADDGTVTPLAESPQEGLSSIGVHIADGQAYVAMSDFQATSDTSLPGIAGLGIFDLETGEQIAFVTPSDLLEEGRHFGNDVTVDANGNAYLTDSFSPAIYQVDPEGNASIFLEDAVLGVEGFGLNGIDYHQQGNYLLVAVAGSGTLYKIPVDDPASFTEVELSEPLSIDGMVLDEESRLIAVASASGGNLREVVRIESADDWATAEVTARTTTIPEAAPTTVALRDGVPYVVHAHFAEMFSGTEVEEFEIVRADFEEDAEG